MTQDDSNRSHKSANHPLPVPVSSAIRKLGADVSLARRRRHISRASLAERIGASLNTIKRLEKGDPRIPLQFVARTLHVRARYVGSIRRNLGIRAAHSDDI